MFFLSEIIRKMGRSRWFSLCKMSRAGKFRETKWGCGRARRNGCASEHWIALGGVAENVLKLESSMNAQL